MVVLPQLPAPRVHQSQGAGLHLGSSDQGGVRFLAAHRQGDGALVQNDAWGRRVLPLRNLVEANDISPTPICREAAHSVLSRFSVGDNILLYAIVVVAPPGT